MARVARQGLRSGGVLLVFSRAVFNLTRSPKLLPRRASGPPVPHDDNPADPGVYSEVGVSQAETVTKAP